VGKFGHMWANGRIRARIASSRNEQTLIGPAAVPVGIAFDPLFSKYLRVHDGVYVYRYLAPAARAVFL